MTAQKHAGAVVPGWALGLGAAVVLGLGGFYLFRSVPEDAPAMEEAAAADPTEKASGEPEQNDAAQTTTEAEQPVEVQPVEDRTRSETAGAETASIVTDSAEEATAGEADTPQVSANDRDAEPAIEETVAAEDAAEDPVIPVEAPRFDVVRVEPDGTAVIAGSAEPGSRVTILLDDTAQADVEVDDSGEFVSLLTLPIAEEPSVLTLKSDAGGKSTASEDQIILAPVPETETESVTVEAAPETGETPTETAQVVTEAPNDQTGTTDLPSETTEIADATPDQSSGSKENTAEPVETVEAQTGSADGTETDTKQAVVEGAADQETEQVRDVGTIATASVDAEQVGREAVATAPEATATSEGTEQQTASLTEPEAKPSAPTVESVGTDGQSAPEPGTAAPTSEDSAGENAKRPAAVAVLRADEDGVEVLQPATEPQPAQVELESISYTETGDVKLRGRAGPGSVVRVYLDNVAVSDIDANGEGLWTGELAGVEPGVYTLRLDELAGTGAVLSRLETPFKREAPEALKQPEPDQPEEVPLIREITVQTGDTLWAISRERYGDGILYVRLFDANRDSITDPDLIYPGQVFTIPE